jgi:UDPglucose 6-dehydrogenase
VEVEVASCPEFLREGTALNDTIYPDRVVIGSNSKTAVNTMLKLHEPLSGQRVITDLSSAELIKYTANAMLAVKISFANLISFYCEKVGANVEAVLDAVGLDKRIGRVFMYPGIGYGGSCFPKDVKALIKIGEALGLDPLLLEAVEKVNKQSRHLFAQKIMQNAPGKKLAIWGLSFKANTDDIREAPSLYIIEELLENGFEITAYDPEGQKNVEAKLSGKIKFAPEAYEGLHDKDALCVFTEWNEFKQADLTKIKTLLKHPFIFDGRNIYSPEEMRKLGFKYYSVGRTET